LGEVDEVAASVFEENCDNGAYVFWFAAEGDAEGFEAVVLGMDVVGDEAGGGNAGGEEALLIGLSWREGRGLEDELDAFGAFGAETVSQRNVGLIGMSLFFMKPRMVV
jgi:hypothetical protein